MAIRFVYFDLGNVLLHFSLHRLCFQLAQLSNKPEAEVCDSLFNDQRYRVYSCGETTTQEYYDEVCSTLSVKPNLDDFLNAMNDIFWTNDLIMPILKKLAKLNFPRGILSNTNDAHWSYVESAFPEIWNAFDAHRVASHKVKTLKPFPEIYQAAFEEAKTEIPDLQPGEVLFIDDLEGNIEGAAKFGFQTIHYVDFDSFLESYKQTNLPLPSRYKDADWKEKLQAWTIDNQPQNEASSDASDSEDDEEDE